MTAKERVDAVTMVLQLEMMAGAKKISVHMQSLVERDLLLEEILSGRFGITRRAPDSTVYVLSENCCLGEDQKVHGDLFEVCRISVVGTRKLYLGLDVVTNITVGKNLECVIYAGALG